MSVFERYKFVRKELKITQTDIAKAIGITQGALSHQENGGNVSIEVLEYIRKAHNVNMNWIFSGEGVMLHGNNEFPTGEILKKLDTLQIMVEELTKDLMDLIKERAVLRNRLEKYEKNKKAS